MGFGDCAGLVGVGGGRRAGLLLCCLLQEGGWMAGSWVVLVNFVSLLKGRVVVDVACR